MDEEKEGACNDLFRSDGEFMQVLSRVGNEIRCASGRIFNLDDPSLLQNFSSLPTHGDRIAQILPILRAKFNYTLTHGQQKNEETSAQLREKGNDLMKRNNLQMSLLKYTESISVAPAHTSALSLAFANRAAVLKLMGHFADSIFDSLQASELGYPDKLQYKLFTRIAQCYQQLDQPQLAVTNYQKALEYMGKSDLSKEDFDKLAELMKTSIEKCNKPQQSLIPADQVVTRKRPPPNIPKLSYGPNPEIPTASACIGLRYNKKFGRHFVATQDIKPGTVPPSPLKFLKVKFMLIDLTFCYRRCSHRGQTRSNLALEGQMSDAL